MDKKNPAVDDTATISDTKPLTDAQKEKAAIAYASHLLRVDLAVLILRGMARHNLTVEDVAERSHYPVAFIEKLLTCRHNAKVSEIAQVIWNIGMEAKLVAIGDVSPVPTTPTN